MKLNLDNFKAPDLTEWRSKIMTETGSNEKHIYHNKVEGIQIDTTDKTNSLNFESDFKTKKTGIYKIPVFLNFNFLITM